MCGKALGAVLVLTPRHGSATFLTRKQGIGSLVGKPVGFVLLVLALTSIGKASDFSIPPYA